MFALRLWVAGKSLHINPKSQIKIKNQLTLEPEGEATGCNPVEVGSIPTGVFGEFGL